MSLAARDVRVTLASRVVLDGVTLAAGEGRITGLVGPNGAGKSTLLKALAGLLRLDDGAITLAGAPISKLSRAELGRLVAYLPQQRTVHWPLSVRRVVALGRLPHIGRRRPAASDFRAVASALETMDVGELADRPVSELSGGELARVLCARALAQEAPVIVADEPTAGLDPAHALALFEVLARLAAEGRTIVVALHDLSLAARYCHEVVVLAGGRVLAAGPPSAVLEPRTLEASFGARMAVGTVEGVPVVVPVSPRR